MLCYPEGTDIILYGNNRMTKKIICLYGDRYNFIEIVDHLNSDKNSSSNSQENVNGIPVRHIGKEFYTEKHNGKIITCFGVKESLDVFKKNGLRTYEDYIPFWMIEYDSIDYCKLLEWFGNECISDIIGSMLHNKKGVIIHGNCQTRIIEIYLKSSKSFSDKYMFIDIPRVFEYTNEQMIENVFCSALWNNVSLYIHHKIKSTNRFSSKLSSDYHISRLLPSAQSVCISNLYFTGYFPQFVKNSNNVLTEISTNGLYPSGDSILDRFAQEGYGIDEILSKIMSEKFYTKKELKNHLNAQFKNIEEREQVCDIKMLDFIKKYYRKKFLFHSPNHPSHFILKELTDRLLRYLGIEEPDYDMLWWKRQLWNLRGQDIPVYPSVAKQLRLRLPAPADKMTYFNNKDIYNMPLTITEWAKGYLVACHNDKYRMKK